MSKQKTYPVGYGAKVVVQEPPILGKTVVTIFASLNKVHFDLEDMRKALDEISNNDPGKSGKADNIKVDPAKVAERSFLDSLLGGGTSAPTSDIGGSLVSQGLQQQVPMDTGRDAPDPWERLQSGDIG